MKESLIMDVIGKTADNETSEDDIEMNFILERDNENEVEIRLDDVTIAVADLQNVLRCMRRLLQIFSDTNVEVVK
jgi:hypothetical protein